MNAVRPWPALALALILAACADDISPPADDDHMPQTPAETLPGPGGAQAHFTSTSEGWYHGVIDASGNDWIYIDLVTQTQVTPVDPAASADWDLAFRGADIKLNGGVSGAPPNGQAVVIHAEKVVPGTAYPFAEVVAAPPPSAVDYVSDAAGFLGLLADRLAMTTYPEADDAPNLAGVGDHGWYRKAGLGEGYAISARANVAYVVRTTECRYYKLRMTAYADGSGNPGHPAFDVLEIDGNGAGCSSGSDGDPVAPLGRATFSTGGAGTTAQIDASDDDAWVYLNLANAEQVTPAQPATDADGWDLAVRRSDFKLNGGVSGTGSVQIHAGLDEDWDARSTAPADGYHSDEPDALAFQTYPPATAAPSSACGGINGDFGWYYYSGFCNDGEGMHHISPRNVVYVIRGHDGQAWKFRVLDYYDANGSSAHPSIEYAPIAP